uniref:Reverse transcriptase domain-containing protein n=1 Tax=Caenorhabditis tropicalis TaxID=1561998 RepID=A0A1I7UGR0_9PELO
MSRPLTYQSSQAVIKYMNPNKRFQVSQCCPEFHRVDKIVPLKLEFLRVVDEKTTINNCTYQWEPPEEDTSSDDSFLSEHWIDLDTMQEAEFEKLRNALMNRKKTNWKHKTMYSRDPNMNVTKLLGLMLEGRKDVHIKCLDVSKAFTSLISWPPSLKLEVEEISVGWLNINGLDDLVLTKPVEVVHKSHLHLDHPIIRNSKKLVLSNLRYVFENGPIVARMPHQWIHIDRIQANKQELLQFIRLVIREWKSAKREPGTRLYACSSFISGVSEILKSIVEEFQGESVSD